MSDNNTNGKTPSLSRRAIVPAMIGASAFISNSASAQTTRRRNLSINDRLALEDLFTEYVWAYDCSDVEGFLDLFTANPLVVGLGRKHEGKEAIAAWFRYLMNIRETDKHLWLHTALHHKYENYGNRCIVYSYAAHFFHKPEDQTRGVRSLGYFVSECIKTDGVWKYNRFSINAWDTTKQPWKKPMPWENI